MDGKSITFDCVFNAIHGNPGENGELLAYFNLIGLKHTSAPYYQMALTFNKRDTLSVVKAYGIKTAISVYLNKGDVVDTDAIIAKVGLPCFIKPNNAGSSYGISKAYTKEEILKGIEVAYKEDSEIFEEYKKENNFTSNYQALRSLVSMIPKFNQVNDGKLILSGDVAEDKKKLDEIPRDDLSKFLNTLENKNRKEKNTIKRTGAFHNENFRNDLTSLLMGDVDLYEVKYHVDWWYNVNQISTALSRKGVSSALINKYEKADTVEKPKGRKRSELSKKVFH